MSLSAYTDLELDVELDRDQFAGLRGEFQKSAGTDLIGGRPQAQFTGYTRVPGQVPGFTVPLAQRGSLDPELEHALNSKPPAWSMERAFDKAPLSASDVVQGLGLSKAMESRLAKLVAREVLSSGNRVELAKSVMSVLLHEGLEPSQRTIINHRTMQLYQRVIQKSGFREVFRPDDLRALQKAGVKYVAKIERSGAKPRYFYDEAKYREAHGTHVSREEGNKRALSKNVQRCVAKAGEGGCGVGNFRDLVKQHGASEVHQSVQNAIKAGELEVRKGRIYAKAKGLKKSTPVGGTTPGGYTVALGSMGERVYLAPREEHAVKRMLLKGNFGIPRKDMLQIRSDLVVDFMSGLRRSGVAVTAGQMSVASIKATQNDINLDKVRGMQKGAPEKSLKKPVIVSADGYLLDGHHRWAALRLQNPGNQLPVIRVGLPMTDLLKAAHAFEGVEYKDINKSTSVVVDALRKAITPIGGTTPGGYRVALKNGKRVYIDPVTGKEKGAKEAGEKQGDMDAHQKELAKRNMKPGTDAYMEAEWLTEAPEGFPPGQLQGEPGKRGGTEAMYWDSKTNDFTAERKKLHEEIIAKVFEGKTPVPDGKQKMAIVMMGGTASGKSTMLHRSGAAGDNFVHVDADDIKGELPEYKRALAMKWQAAAGFAHEESSTVAKQASKRAVDEGYNVVLDGTGANERKFIKQVEMLKEAGYHVHLMMPDQDKDAAVEAAAGRANRTGRYVPDAFIAAAYDRIPGNFFRVAAMCDSGALYDRRQDSKMVWSKDAGGNETEHDPAFLQNYPNYKPQKETA